ncbi:MAG: 2,3,4,5-tetrahydropyridine-2,6-dicarboxylate N-succinyltransferase, partial [Burkholderiales bacterium]|nr:2,3,4,5-tetrahydropyridine-2,6-dicarboxylate N-succinyltransferase [Burkholderiales bacterium]
MSQLQQIIETAFENRTEITPANVPSELRDTINSVILGLDKGEYRVAEKIDGQWHTH